MTFEKSPAAIDGLTAEQRRAAPEASAERPCTREGDDDRIIDDSSISATPV